MIAGRRGWRGLAVLAGVVVAWAASDVRAQDTATTAPASPPDRPGAVAVTTPPPFWVAGVVIGPERRSAVLVPLDEARKELGAITLREGERYEGHLLMRVEPERVLLERGGTVLALPVGRPYSGPRGAADAPRPVTGPIFVPGPDKPKPDFEYTGPQVTRGQGGGTSSGVSGGAAQPGSEAVEDLVNRLFGHPQMRQQIEEIRPIIRQKMERARQDGQTPVRQDGRAPESGAAQTAPQGLPR